jgi:hypothetical protein
MFKEMGGEGEFVYFNFGQNNVHQALIDQTLKNYPGITATSLPASFEGASFTEEELAALMKSDPAPKAIWSDNRQADMFWMLKNIQSKNPPAILCEPKEDMLGFWRDLKGEKPSFRCFSTINPGGTAYEGIYVAFFILNGEKIDPTALGGDAGNTFIYDYPRITNDNLDALVDAQVYLKVKADEDNVKASQYNVANYEMQIVNLARTTLRNIIGTLTLKSANSERGKINEELRSTLLQETASWGIEILRTELKEIDPPEDVQITMNKVVKAENEKVAAIDFATATETQADGQRRAEIKKAEGIKQARILAAEGDAQAIQLVNEAAEKYFVGNAQVLRKLEAVERALAQNAKVVVPADAELINVIGELAGVVPVAPKPAATTAAQAPVKK